MEKGWTKTAGVENARLEKAEQKLQG